MANGTPSSELVRYNQADLASIETDYTPAQLMAIAGAVAQGPANRQPKVSELQHLAFAVKATGLDYFRREIILAAFNRGGPLVPYTSYIGEFTLASRVVPIVKERKAFKGTDPNAPWEPFWLDDIWGPPAIARVQLWIEGVDDPVEEYAPWGVWAKGTVVDEQVPAADGATEVRTVDVWADDPSGARWPQNHSDPKKAGRPKRVKLQEQRRMPAMVYTGRKIRKPVPDSPWDTMASFMLAKCALKLACTTAARITGRSVDTLEKAGIAKLRNWAYALLKEVDRAGDDEFRKELSGGKSWSFQPEDGSAPMDIEDWADVLGQLQVLKEKRDREAGLEGTDPFEDVENVGKGATVVPEVPAPTPSAGGGTGDRVENGRGGRRPVASPPPAANVGGAPAPAAAAGNLPPASPPGAPPAPPEAKRATAEAFVQEVADAYEALEGDPRQRDPRTLPQGEQCQRLDPARPVEGKRARQCIKVGPHENCWFTPPPEGPPDGTEEWPRIVDGGVVDEVAEDLVPEAEGPEDPPGYSDACGEVSNQGEVCTLATGHAPTPHNWPSLAAASDVQQMTEEQENQLLDLAAALNKPAPDPNTSTSKAANLIELWSRQLAAIHGTAAQGRRA